MKGGFFATTPAALTRLPLSSQIKKPLVAAVEAGIVRKVRHNMKEGAPTLFIHIPHRTEQSAIGRLQELRALWDINSRSTFTVNLPAVLTDRPQLIVQCATPLFGQPALQMQVAAISGPTTSNFFNSAGLELIDLLKGRGGIGAISFEEMDNGMANIHIDPADPKQPEYLLVNACVQAFNRFGLKLAFAK